MNKIKALKKYLETVRHNVQSTVGPIQEFWAREVKRTSAKIESLTK